MILLLKLAWRNLFRNTRRTVLSGLAIGLGLASLIFYDALIIGMTNAMITSATATFPGQAQVHRAGFRKTLDVAETIKDPEGVLAGLGREPEVKAYAPRTLSYGMLSSAADVSSVLLYGVDPEKERAVSRLALALRQGRYLDPGDPNAVYLGEKLAQNLGVGLGDRVVVTVAQAGTGDLSQEMFRVGGIFKFGAREMDSGLAFINLAKAQQLLQVGGGLHEIAVTFRRLQDASNAAWSFWGRFSAGGNEAVSWVTLFPEMNSILDMTRFAVLISALILFGIVSFGIMNTLFMSLYERMFEFGVIRAVGTRPYQVALIMLLEACSLAVVSIAIGTLLAWGLTAVYGAVGIDYRGLEFTGITVRDLIYPVMRPYQYTVYPLWLFGFTALVGLYPALYAARMAPAKAMKRSL
jgi:ABC-type lipoprotein release transport system permease subunit